MLDISIGYFEPQVQGNEQAKGYYILHIICTIHYQQKNSRVGAAKKGTNQSSESKRRKGVWDNGSTGKVIIERLRVKMGHRRLKLESAVAHFYTQSFYDYFARAAIVPHTL